MNNNFFVIYFNKKKKYEKLKKNLEKDEIINSLTNDLNHLTKKVDDVFY